MHSVEDDFLPLSYIAQYGYCPRRAGLLLLEQAWAENEYTALGREQHHAVHLQRTEKRGERIKLYEHRVFSAALGLSGKCDCLELTADDQGCALPFLPAKYLIFPVEFKHGRVRQEREYQMQLCAQAICLEEMYSTTVEQGALYFIDAKRRDTVVFAPDLRAETKQAAQCLKEILAGEMVPAACFSPKCRKCSLLEYCAPQIMPIAKSYCQSLWQAAEHWEKEV